MSSAEQSQSISTPVHALIDPSTDSHVTLVGIIHYAQPEYYHAVQEMIGAAARDGATVHYEGVRMTPPEAIASVTPKRIGDKILLLRQTLDNVYAEIDDLGLTHQRETLKYYADWENHDATDVEIVEHISYLTLRRYHIASTLMKGLISRLNHDQKRETILEALRKADNQRDLLRRVLLGNIDNGVVHLRNNVALQAIDEQRITEPDKSFTLIWGSAHLPGITNGLMQRGYRMLRVSKLIAIDPTKL